METLRTLETTFVCLNIDNIDTDQIIPARYLKVTHRDGLGKAAFSDWRYDADGNPIPTFVLNQPAAQGAEVLVTGDNFGCGSSREHAPWALRDCGLRAIVSTSIADIFRNNAVKNGLLPIVVDPDFHATLRRLGSGTITVDLESCVLRVEDGRQTTFSIEPFARFLLLNGQDELDFLLNQENAIQRFEEHHP